MKASWEDMDMWSQAMLLSYHEIREIEENDEKIECMKAMIPRV